MTVAELIEKLTAFDPSAKVVMMGDWYDGEMFGNIERVDAREMIPDDRNYMLAKNGEDAIKMVAISTF